MYHVKMEDLEVIEVLNIENIIEIVNDSLNLFDSNNPNKDKILKILPKLKINIKIIDNWIFENTPEFNTVNRTNYINIFNHINERSLPGENILPLLSNIYSLEHRFKQEEIEKLIKCSKISNLDSDIINSDIWIDHSKYDYTCYTIKLQFKGLLKLFTENKKILNSILSHKSNSINAGFA